MACSVQPCSQQTAQKDTTPPPVKERTCGEYCTSVCENVYESADCIGICMIGCWIFGVPEVTLSAGTHKSLEQYKVALLKK